MIAQVTAAALVSENKQRAYPASVDSIPTSANQEDHVSMAAHGARRLLPMAENAAQRRRHRAARRRARLRLPRAAEVERAARSGARALLRERVPHLDDDRYLHPTSRRRSRWCASGALVGRGRRRAAAASRRSGLMSGPTGSTVDARRRAAAVVSLPHTGTDIPPDIEAEPRLALARAQGRRLVDRPALRLRRRAWRDDRPHGASRAR